MMKALLTLTFIIIIGVMILFLSNTVFVDVEKPDSQSNENTTVTTEAIVLDENVEEISVKAIEYEIGLYSWEEDVYQPKNRAPMYAVMDYLEIDEVYQSFADVDIESSHVKNFVNELQLMDVDLYTLVGHRNWAYEANGEEMLGAIDDAVVYREIWGKDTVKGIVFDIEPFISNRWKDGEGEMLMDNFVKGMEIAYTAAKKHDIRVILCYPVWYDAEYYNHFLELGKFCDEMSVMNYDRPNEYENIIDEIEYAREMDKSVTCIFEFQVVGAHGLTDEETYNNAGIEAAISNFEDIYSRVEYPKLKFAYHYLNPIQDMVLE